MIVSNKMLLDAPYRIGVSGKYKLKVVKITPGFDDFEYVLVDSQFKEYGAFSKIHYAVDSVLRCIVTFEIKLGKLVVSETHICSKQDIATPIFAVGNRKVSIKPAREVKKTNDDNKNSLILSDTSDTREVKKTNADNKNKDHKKNKKVGKKKKLTTPPVNNHIKTKFPVVKDSPIINGSCYCGMTVKSSQEWNRVGCGKYLYCILDIKGREYYATSNKIYALNDKVVCYVIEDNGVFFSFFKDDSSSVSIGKIEGNLVTRADYKLCENSRSHKQLPNISSGRTVLFGRYEKYEKYNFVVTGKCDLKGNQILEDSFGRLHLLIKTEVRYETGDEVKCTVIDFGKNLDDLISGDYLILSKPCIVNKTTMCFKKSPEDWYNKVNELGNHKCGKAFRCSCCGQNFPANAGVRVDLKDIYFCNSCAKKIYDPKKRGNKHVYILTPMGNKR